MGALGAKNSHVGVRILANFSSWKFVVDKFHQSIMIGF